MGMGVMMQAFYWYERTFSNMCRTYGTPYIFSRHSIASARPPLALSPTLCGRDESFSARTKTGCTICRSSCSPEDGRACVCGLGEDTMSAFTRDGIEDLKQIIADKRAAGNAPPELESPKYRIRGRPPNEPTNGGASGGARPCRWQRRCRPGSKPSS